MSIFSKVKNAKKAAEQHKRASSEAQVGIKPPTPYKHIPTHAAQDALSCAPTSWSAEESRAKISAAHRRKSGLSRQSSFIRTTSDSAMASRGYIHRTDSDLSIESVMTKQRHSSYQPPSQYAYNGHLSSRSRPYFTHASSSSSMAMKRSPLSNTSTKEEEEGENVESSNNSTHSSASSQALEMKPTASRETKTEPSGSRPKNRIVEITSPRNNEISAPTEKAKGAYFSNGLSSLSAQTPIVTPTPAVSRRTSKRNWFGKRNTVSVY